VVTNLSSPPGLHRRTVRVTVEACPRLHRVRAALAQALGGIPHRSSHKPEVVALALEGGGVVLEARLWTLGWHPARAACYQAAELMASVLPRMGVALLGPSGPSRPWPPDPPLGEDAVADILGRLGLPARWAAGLKDHLILHRPIPGEGLIREGDEGESLFLVLEGRLHVVRAEERRDPQPDLRWEVLAELGPGQWFGEASLLTGAPRNATVVAATACRVAEIPKGAFERSLKGDPQLIEGLVDLMAVRAAGRSSSGKTCADRDMWLDQIKRWFRL
jgi:hypothetical protein